MASAREGGEGGPAASTATTYSMALGNAQWFIAVPWGAVPGFTRFGGCAAVRQRL